MPQKIGKALGYAVLIWIIGFGITFGVVNLLLDLLVLVLLFGNGVSYFASLTVWLAYIILMTVPWLVGRPMSEA